MGSILDDPLATVGLRGLSRTDGNDSAVGSSAARPLVLRNLRPAPNQDTPAYVYDPLRQIATDPAGFPLVPSLAKQWTTTEGTHTDGDGGDNENWSWEE